MLNAYRKLHYIYSTQLGTQVADHEPTLASSCKVSYDPQPYYCPEALVITTSEEPEDIPEYRITQEDISDYNYPEEIPGMSVHDSRMRRFHDCLDAATEAHIDEEDEHLFAVAILEQLADGCRQMGLPQAWCARVASFYPRLNVMTGTPEYRQNALGYGFMPLDQAARNTMAIKALKAGVDSWDKDLNRYIDSNLIPRYYPMEDYIYHLPKWNGKHDYVSELARRVKTDNPFWEEDFHKWMLSMVAQWLGKNLQHGNAIVPLLIGPQGIGKTVFCSRLLPGYLQTYFNDRLSMKNDNDIFLAMSGYALINIDEFDAMSLRQDDGGTPALCLVHRHDQQPPSTRRSHWFAPLHLRLCRRDRQLRAHQLRPALRSTLCRTAARPPLLDGR